LSVTDPTSVAPQLNLSVHDRSPRLVSATPAETFGLLLDDRGLFAEAQGLLAEVSGCPLRRASSTLLLTAAHQHVHVRQIARRFVNAMANQHEGRQDALVIDLVAAALSADTTGPMPGAFAAGDPQRFDAAPPDLIGPARLGHIRGVRARGELDLLTAGELLLVATENLGGVAAETVGTAFYVDLEGVTFLDGAGLGALAGISNQARDRGQRLVVSTPTAAGPRNLLALAVARRWLVPEFAPADHDTPTAAA
jgi:anti-anti-sigma factor